MPRPELTVIIPAFNMDRWLPYAVESCLWQSERNIDVLIVNDGSRDSTQAMAEAFARADARVRVHRQENMGLGRTRAVGQAMARGRYLTWLDADDFLAPRAAEKMLAVAHRDRVQMVCGNAVVFSDKSFNTRRYFPHPAARRTTFDNPRYWKSKVAWRWIFGTDFMQGENIEHPALKLGQDVVTMYDALTRVGHFSQCPDEVYYFRQEHKGMDSSLDTEIEHQLLHYVPVRRLLVERGRIAPLVKYLAENCVRDLRLLMPRLTGEDARWLPRVEEIGREIFAGFSPQWLEEAKAAPGLDTRELAPLALAFASGDMAEARRLLLGWEDTPSIHVDKSRGWHAFRRRVKAFFSPRSLKARSLHARLELRARRRLGGMWRGREELRGQATMA